MAQLSPIRARVPILDGLTLLHRGKVRDSYKLEGPRRLPVATDGISIFDFVLNGLVPEKGRILNAMSHFWFKHLESKGMKTHMITAGSEIDVYLPEHLRGDLDLQCRAMVVHELRMIPIEFIVRNCLTGSVLKEYQKSGTVYGQRLEEGLQDGDLLEHPLFTPTTKAEEGHDEETNAAAVAAEHSEATFRFREMFAHVFAHGKNVYILVADGKGEGGYDKNRIFRIGDEISPDSCRFWDALAHERSRREKVRKAPPPFDKQLVRAWGIEQGINKLDPKNPEDVAHVHSLEVPEELVAATTATYRYIFWRLTGRTFEEYVRNEMDVMIPRRTRKLAVVFGSGNDIPFVTDALKSVDTPALKDGIERMDVHVISCHRNPVELDAFAASGCDGADVVIAAGGKALALPGVLDALLHQTGKKIPVIGVALAGEDPKSEQAALLSIEELPGEPVIIEETKGTAYAGPQGFMRALMRVAHGEFPPPKPRASKPAHFNVDLSKY